MEANEAGLQVSDQTHGSTLNKTKNCLDKGVHFKFPTPGEQLRQVINLTEA